MSGIGENIRNERMRANLKQNQLAEALEIGQAAISRFENNTRRPSVKLLKKIAATLGCSFAVLVNEDNEGSDDLSMSTKSIPSNYEDDIEKNFIRTLLAQNPDLSVKLRSLAKRSKELSNEDWLLLVDHIIHAFGQMEFLLKNRG